MPTTSATPSRALPAWWPWGIGALVGMVVLGPALGGGSLLSLDLLVTPRLAVPNGVFGLGPSLSQRVPLFALLAVPAAVLGGPLTVKVFLVGCTAAGTAGAARLVRALAPAGVAVGPLGQLAVGVLWSAGPWALTRVGVGHVNLLWVVAVLPWALPRLCRPADRWSATFLASLALAIGGPSGGTLGLAVVAVGLVLGSDPGRRLRAAAVALCPHVLWVGPTLVILWAGAGVSGAGSFVTSTGGVGGWPSLVVGGGFWRVDHQVGATGVVGLVTGVLVLVAALTGGRRVIAEAGWRSWQGAAVAVALGGLILAAASALPGVRVLYEALTDLPIGAPLRESQRFLALWLVTALPLAVVGVEGLVGRVAVPAGRWALRAAPVVVALVLSVPGWWGVHGRLDPVEFPRGWAAARQLVAQAPGPVVALPWSEYPPISFADGRQVFNPLPEYLGGDVISSYDPRFDPERPRQEQVDGRAVVVDDLVARLRGGEPISSSLADLGVRWVALAEERGAEELRPGLEADDGLREVLVDPAITLYEVRGAAARPAVDRPIPPVIRVAEPRVGAVVDVAGAPGWVQGWSTPVRVTDDGRLVLAGGSGLLWFWPALVLVVVDLAVLVAAARAVRAERRFRNGILARLRPRG